MYKFVGLFGKAKRKILGQEQEEPVYSGGLTSSIPDVPVTTATGHGPSGIDPSLWEPQELGTYFYSTTLFVVYKYILF